MAKAPDTTLCLINFNSGVYDITGQATVINNGVTLSSDQTKYNLQSGYFDYSNLNNVLITLPSEAKTVSIWFYPTGSNTSGWYPTIWSSQAFGVAGGTYTHIDDGSYGTYPVYRVNSSSSTYNNGTTGSTLISRDTWHHYAYCNSGTGNHYFFLDGVLQATVSQSSPNTLTILSLGGLMGSSSSLVDGCYYSGYIGEVLITSDCLYTSDFNVPTEAYTWDDEVDVPINIQSTTSYGTYSGSIANLTDGNTSTYWWTNSAQSQSSFITFSFSKPVTFNGLTAITLNNTGDCISSGTVLQVSEDGNVWTTVGNFTGEAECTFSNLNQKNISYVRIYVETSSNKWLCVNEITLDYIEPVIQLYVKVNSAWVAVTDVYKKVNGDWVRQSKDNLSSLFSSEIKYVKK